MNKQKQFLSKNKYILLFLAAVAVTLAVRALPLLQARAPVSFTRDDLYFWGKTGMYSGEVECKRGIYTVHVDNVTDIEYTFALEEFPTDRGTIKGERKRLQPGSLSGETRFYLSNDSTVVFHCDTVEDRDKIWEVRELNAHIIYRPMMSFVTSAVHVFLFYAILAAFLLSVRYFRRTPDPFGRLIPLLTLLFILLICSPLFAGSVAYSHDQEFHMARIASLAQEMRALRIPSRIGQTMQNGYGYPVSIFYGDLFLVPVAVLYACGLPMWECYQLLLIQICVMTVLIAQYAFGELAGNRTDGFCVSLIYTGSVRFLVNIYLRGAVGEGLAMAFLPLAALGFFRLFHAEERVRQQAVLPLAAGYTGIILSHTLTAVQTVWIAALFCLCMIRQLFRDGRIALLLKAAGCAALLTVWFTVPFLDYYCRHEVSAKQNSSILDSLLKPVELLFPRSQLASSGFSILLLLVTGVCFFVLSGRGGETKSGMITGALAVLMLFMTTNLMPWQFMMEHLPALYGVLGGKIQFAHRFFTPATLLVCAFACAGIRAYRKTRLSGAARYRACFAVLIVMTLFQAWNIRTEMMSSDYFLSPVEALSDYADTLYLPSGSEEAVSAEELWCRIAQTDIVTDPGVEIADESVIRDGTSVLFSAENGNDTESDVLLPVWHYYGYEAMGDTGPLPVGDGEYHKIRVTLPARFSGTVTVAFREPLYWRLAEAVSLVTLFCCAWLLFRKRGRKAEAV